MRRVSITSHSRYPVDRKRLRRQTEATLAQFGMADDYAVHILIAGDTKVSALNKKWMKKEGTTTVLSFPLVEFAKTKPSQYWPDDGSRILDLGEVVISYPQAKKRAMLENKTIDDVIDFLADHGLRHLMGQHHD